MKDKNAIEKLTDDSLEAASGGTFIGLENYAEAGQVEHVFRVGDIVDVKCFGFSNVRCRITKLGVDSDNQAIPGGAVQKVFVDTYYCEKLEPNLLFINGWKERDQIVITRL